MALSNKTLRFICKCIRIDNNNDLYIEHPRLLEAYEHPMKLYVLFFISLSQTLADQSSSIDCRSKTFSLNDISF